MNEPKVAVDRRELMFKNVRENARCQATAECRENYFRSCEAHAGDMLEVVAVVRKEFSGP
jgi:hypothetical protein